MRNLRDKRFCFTLALAILGMVALSAGGLLAEGKEEKAPASERIDLLEEELEKKVVEITPLGGLKPSEISSGKGTTVIWINHSPNDIRILFQGGDQVTFSCVNPQNFAPQGDGTFQSEVIPQGGTASLCFVEAGEYKYQVVQTSGPEKRDPTRPSNDAPEGVVHIH